MTACWRALLLASVVAWIPTAPANGLDTVPVALAELPRVYRLDGIAEAIHSGTVSAQTSGRVVAVNVDVDDVVAHGAVIVELEDAQQSAALRRAEANLAAARAGRRDAEAEHGRIREVFERDVVSRAEMDRVQAALDQARANEAAAEAAVHEAQQALSYTQVRAPYNGIVTERLIEVGEMAQPGVALMSGISLDRMRISVDVPQNLVDTIRRERNAQAQVNGQWVKAESVTVFPIADPRSDTFKVRLRLPEATAGVFPGMFVKVGFVVGSQRVLVIPLSAVVTRSEVVAVYVVDDKGQVGMRHVRLGSAAGPGHVTVLSGLAQGEAVAVDPVAAAILLKAQRGAGSGHG